MRDRAFSGFLSVRDRVLPSVALKQHWNALPGDCLGHLDIT